MDKAKLFAAPGGTVKSGSITLADGSKETLYYRTRTPNEIACFAGGERRYSQTEDGDLQREVARAGFVAAAFCNEDGTTLMSAQEAQGIPSLVKFDLCMMVVTGSSQIGDAGKASQPGATITSGTS